MKNLIFQIIPDNSTTKLGRSIITLNRIYQFIISKIFQIFLFFVISIFSTDTQSQWQNVGIPGFSAGQGYFQSLALDGITPYVGYRDEVNGYRSTVMKYNGVSWENVGEPGFGQMDLDICLKINNGVPYVALGDNCIVMKFNGTDWEYVGNPGFAYSVDYMNIDFYENIPFVAFRDNIYATKASAMKFDGSNWIYIGNPGFSAGYVKFVRLALDGSSPYVAYSDGSMGFKATVKKFDGFSWVNVGNPAFSLDAANFLSLTLNGETPFVAFQDGGNGGKTTVMKFNGINWENVGNPGFSVGAATNQSLVIIGNTPYVAYSDIGNGSKTTVMKFNGISWENVGSPGFSAGIAEYQSLSFNGNIPYVAYQDWANDRRTTVMRFGDDPYPVELSSFSSSVDYNNVSLFWMTATEMNNSGFDIERSNVKGQTSNEWMKISFVQGHGTTASPNNYEFTDRNLSSGKYKYRLKQIDFNGNFEYYNLSDEVVIGVPEKFSLEQNYPNPFNPITVIRYSLSENSFVTLKVYDVIGNEVATIVNEKQNSGTYNYQFSTVNYQLSSGVYFYKIEAGSFSAVKRMIIIK